MKALLAMLAALLFAPAASAAEATAVDRQRRPVPDAVAEVRFTASGDFEIIGSPVAGLEGGTASILVRVRRAAPRGSIKARAGGIGEGSLRR
jgi:hypothetical protein